MKLRCRIALDVLVILVIRAMTVNASLATCQATDLRLIKHLGTVRLQPDLDEQAASSSKPSWREAGRNTNADTMGRQGGGFTGVLERRATSGRGGLAFQMAAPPSSAPGVGQSSHLAMCRTTERSWLCMSVDVTIRYPVIITRISPECFCAAASNGYACPFSGSYPRPDSHSNLHA
jgi:hypothetical protein